jgi:hypothetical protein
MKCGRTARPSFCLIDLSLVAWTVLDTLHFKLLFDVFGDTPLHRDCIHATHIFIYHRVLASGCTKTKEGGEEMQRVMTQAKTKQKKKRTRSLPPRHPAFLRIGDRNAPVEMCRRTRLNPIW